MTLVIRKELTAIQGTEHVAQHCPLLEELIA